MCCTPPVEDPRAAELHERVCRAWAAEAVPTDPILRARYSGSSDARDVWEWLGGSRWNDGAWRHDGHRMDVESPFFYLVPQASVYYLGGYLLCILECFHEGFSASALDHLIFAGNLVEFEWMVAAMSREQREACLAVMAFIAAEPEVFDFRPEDAAKLAVMLGKLGA